MLYFEVKTFLDKSKFSGEKMKRILISLLGLMAITSLLYSDDVSFGIKYGRVSNMPYPAKNEIGASFGFSLFKSNFWLEINLLAILSRNNLLNGSLQTVKDLNLIYQLPEIKIIKMKVNGLVGTGVGYLESECYFMDLELSSYLGTRVATDSENKSSFTKNLMLGLNIFPLSMSKGDEKGIFIRPEFRVYQAKGARIIKMLIVAVGITF